MIEKVRVEDAADMRQASQGDLFVRLSRRVLRSESRLASTGRVAGSSQVVAGSRGVVRGSSEGLRVLVRRRLREVVASD